MAVCLISRKSLRPCKSPMSTSCLTPSERIRSLSALSPFVHNYIHIHNIHPSTRTLSLSLSRSHTHTHTHTHTCWCLQVLVAWNCLLLVPQVFECKSADLQPDEKLFDLRFLHTLLSMCSHAASINVSIHVTYIYVLYVYVSPCTA